MTAALVKAVRARAALAGVALPDEAVDRLVAYLELLALWNRRINLTAFDLSSVHEEAIDRLVIEPVMAARLVRPGDGIGVDIGSGGGSPAVPLMLVVPSIALTMVEVRARKGAFLREVVRTLRLPAEVEVCRAEAVAARRPGAFGLVMFRAVRADRAFWRVVDALLAPGGRVLWFGGLGQKIEEVYDAAGSCGETVALERKRP